jgi:hypothetical protein
MAQTKRKRRSKHRGTAGGTVVARGRTGRKPTGEEVKQNNRAEARRKRQNRYEKPPTWKGSFQRSLIVTAVFIVLVIVALRGPVAGALILIPFVLILYTVLGYYTDLWLHRRWLKRKAAGR